MKPYRYLIIKLAVFASALVACTIGSAYFIRTDLFLAHSSNISQIISSFKFANLSDINADIVFVGDSTAVVGVDPGIVDDVTGLTSYNLSLTVGSFIAVGDIILERYLAQNRPPKFIVLYIGPWTTPTRPEWMVGKAFALQYPSWEATFAVVNFARDREAIGYFARFPGQLPALLRWSASQFWRGYDSGPAKQVRIDGALAQYQGWIPLETGVAGLPSVRGIPDGCRLAPYDAEPDAKFIGDFRRKYETRQTKVLVVVSPIPDCDESLAQLRRAYRGIADLLPRALPHRYFADDQPRHNHLLEEGSEVNSEQIGEYIRTLLE
jgi:hypothetical protein